MPEGFGEVSELKAWRLSALGGKFEFRDVTVPVRSGTVLVSMEAVPLLTYLGHSLLESCLPTIRPRANSRPAQTALASSKRLAMSSGTLDLVSAFFCLQI